MMLQRRISPVILSEAKDHVVGHGRRNECSAFDFHVILRLRPRMTKFSAQNDNSAGCSS